MVRVCSVVRCARAVRMLHNIEVRGMRMLHNMEVHAPSWPSTACDFGGPRSVVAPRAGPADATERVTPFGCGARPLWVFNPLYQHRLPSINTGLPVSNTGIL